MAAILEIFLVFSYALRDAVSESCVIAASTGRQPPCSCV